MTSSHGSQRGRGCVPPLSTPRSSAPQTHCFLLPSLHLGFTHTPEHRPRSPHCLLIFPPVSARRPSHLPPPSSSYMTQSTCQLLWHTTRGDIIYKGERSCLGLGCLEANIPHGRHPKSQSVQEWQKKQGPNSQESFPIPVRKTFSPISSNAFL